MQTKTIDVRDAQGKLVELLKLVSSGGEVILIDGSEPVARLVPIGPKKELITRTTNLHPSAISTTDDFDEPLPDDFWIA